MLKLIIFDLDGVIIDSIKIDVEFIQMLRKQFELPELKKSDEIDCYTLTSREIFRKHFKQISFNEVQKEARKLRFNFERKIGLMKHAKELLKELKPDYKIALATNRSDETFWILKRLNIYGFFEYITTADSVKHPKPHPESLLKIMKHFKVKAKDTIYVGDTFIDSQCAKKAKVKSIIYKNKYNSDYKVEDMLEVIDIIKKVDDDGKKER